MSPALAGRFFTTGNARMTAISSRNSKIRKDRDEMGLPRWLSGKNLSAHVETQEIQVRSLGQKDPLEKEMATYSSILAWRIPWTEEPGGLQPMGLQRMGTYLSVHERTHVSLRVYQLYVYIFFIFFSIMVYHRVWNILPCAIH